MKRMKRKRQYGSYGIGRDAHSLDMGKCAACGANNPTLPGEERATKCVSCGSDVVAYVGRPVSPQKMAFRAGKPLGRGSGD